MKKSARTLKFDRISVAELNSNELLHIQGGTNSSLLTQAVSQMTPAIVTSILIGKAGNAD